MNAKERLRLLAPPSPGENPKSINHPFIMPPADKLSPLEPRPRHYPPRSIVESPGFAKSHHSISTQGPTLCGPSVSTICYLKDASGFKQHERERNSLRHKETYVAMKVWKEDGVWCTEEATLSYNDFSIFHAFKFGHYRYLVPKTFEDKTAFMVIWEMEDPFFQNEAYIWRGKCCVWHLHGKEEIYLMKQADENPRKDDIVYYGNIAKATRADDWWFGRELDNLEKYLQRAENGAIEPGHYNTSP